MDPLSQGALGAAWAQPAARTPTIVLATLIGGAAAMSPDLDLFIRSRTDPLLALELHRHFTHSLVFIPFGAAICAAFFYPLVRSTLDFRSCYGFSLLGFASHALLDACTSYGTMLLWPFSEDRIAWDLVSVIDPLLSVPLIVFVILGATRRRPVFAVLGIAWCLGYLGLGQIQNQRATAATIQLAAMRGHSPESIEAKPSFANLFVWKTIYASEDSYFVDAVRVGVGISVFEGVERPVLDIERDFPWLQAGSQQARDIERFRWFANGYLTIDPDRPNRIVDLRYSLVPNTADAFWGIELDPDAARDAHVAYVTMRDRSLAEGRELLRMLFRRQLNTNQEGNGE